jgi:hypothetical protein
MATDLKQRQHEAGELMAHRHAREAHADIRAGAADHEARLALVVGGDHRDLVRQDGDLVDQLAHL